MTNVPTETITLSIRRDTVARLRALTSARNGSIHNVADEALTAGIGRILDFAPEPFLRRYEAAIVKGKP